MAKSAAMIVTFVLLGLFSFQVAAQAPAPAPTAGGPVPPPPPAASPPPPAPVAPTKAPTPVPAAATPTPSVTPTPTPSTLVPSGVAGPEASVEAPGPSESSPGAGSRQGWSGVAVASVIVAAMVL